jgi:hypothetical protein
VISKYGDVGERVCYKIGLLARACIVCSNKIVWVEVRCCDIDEVS